MSVTREQLLDYTFYLQGKLGNRFNDIVKKLTYGVEAKLLDPILINIIQEALVTYYPEEYQESKITLSFSGTFPGSYNTDFKLKSKDDILVIGNLTFLFTTLAQFNDEFAALVNAGDFLTAEVSGSDVILTFPAFIDADFAGIDKTDNGEALAISAVVTQRGICAETNCLTEDEMCELINFAEKWINSTETC